MTKWFIYIEGPNGSKVSSVSTEQIAKAYCILAISSGCWRAFYAQ